MKYIADTFREIFYYLRQYKGRTFMTMFGIIWGTLTVILLLAFGVGVQKSMSKNMHGMGDGIAIMWPGRTSIPFEGYGRERYMRFRAEDVELLRSEISEILYISPEYGQWGIPIRVGDKINYTYVSGQNTEYSEMRNEIPEPGGRWLNDLDLKDRKRVCFIGNKLKDLIFGEQTNAVGKYVFIGDNPFLVVGVLKKKIQSSSYNTQDENRVFIPYTTFESVFGNKYINNMVYKLKDPRDADLVRTKIYQVFGKKFKFDPKDTQALGIWDTTEMNKFIYYFTLGFKIFLGIIGAITLVVGGIGLANIMYVVVQERTIEIGIKRSIGAKRKHIMGQFILEAFMIIGIGAAIGFGLAVILIKLISFLPIENYVGHPELSLSVAFISISILSIIGFLAGYFPSRKAARLNVIDCLRY